MHIGVERARSPRLLFYGGVLCEGVDLGEAILRLSCHCCDGVIESVRKG